MTENVENENRPSPGGITARWAVLSPGGRRRVGEFFANMLLGVAASITTLIVLPAVAGRSPGAELSAAWGVPIVLLFAILALLVRILTEER